MELKDNQTLPLGRGREFLKEREQMKVRATEVKNMVAWVNPAFPEAPFHLQEGESSKLGMFFTPNESQENIFFVSVLPEIERSRSGTIGSVIFKDSKGRLYRDVDIKGGGHIGYKMGKDPEVRGMEGGTEEDISGIFDEKDALRDKDYAEKFLEAGIRTYRILAIIDLEEIIDGKGEKLSIVRAKEKGILPPNSKPVISVRAFGTKERVRGLDPFFANNSKRQEESLLDALSLVAGELGKDSKWFYIKDYIEWFAKTLGANIAKIHKLGLCHGFLSFHNVTLDCRIVDLDSVQTIKEAVKEKAARGGSWREESIYEQEREDADWTLHHLFIFIQSLKEESSVVAQLAEGLPSEDQLVLFLKESYIKELNRP